MRLPSPVPLEQKIALSLAATTATCLASGGGFACAGLLASAGLSRQLADLFLIGAIAFLGLGALTCELIWVWAALPFRGRPDRFTRWTDETRFALMLLLRWTGAFTVFFLSFRSVRPSDLLFLGFALACYGLMLGFIDSATLSALRRPTGRPTTLGTG